MTIIFICNIGSQDLKAPHELLPEQFHPNPVGRKDNQRFSERERAAYIKDHFSELKTHLTLPIIDKALDYIQDEPLENIVLVGSDQDDPRYRETDTIATAQVIRDLLITRGFPATFIQLWPLRVADQSVSPADVDAVMRFYEQRLHQLDRDELPEVVYLQVTGGTPAMSSALLLAGTEVFQARAAALYVSKNSPMPQRLAVGQRLLAAPIREVLQSNIKTYQYDAAALTWHQFQPYFVDHAASSTATLIAALIKHAAARVNLDLDAARLAIRGLDALAGGRYRSLIEPLYASLVPRSRQSELVEVLHVARVRLETKVYSDFLAQIVRFLENMLRFVCLELGVQFINWKQQPDPAGARVANAWADQHGLGKVPVGQSGLQKVLKTVFPQDPKAQAVLRAADRLENVIRLRNEATHSLQGVAPETISEAFGADVSQVLPTLEQVYHQVVQAPIPAHPYSLINQTIQQLLIPPAS